MRFTQIFSLGFSLVALFLVCGMTQAEAQMTGTICQPDEMCDIQPGPNGPESAYLFKQSPHHRGEIILACHLKSSEDNFNVAIYAGGDLIIDSVDQATEDRPHHFTLKVAKAIDTIIHVHFKSEDDAGATSIPQGAVKFMSILASKGYVSCSLTGAHSMVNNA